MQRVPRHRLLLALSAFLSLAALAILPFGGVASAAPKSTICQNGEGLNCFLEISAPDSVAVGQPFTVKVTLWEYGVGDNPDIPLPKSDFCASKTGVSLDLSQGEGPITTYFSKASAGVATFSVSVPNDGFWSLHARVLHPEGSPNCGYFDDDFADFTAVTVQADQPIAPCPDNNPSCVQVTNAGAGGGSAATLFANDGSGTFDPAQFEPFVDGTGCAAPPTDPISGVLNFQFIGGSLDTEKTIVMTLNPSLVNKGIGQFNICWESSNPFKVAGGGDAVFNTATLLFVGYLPNCSPQAGAPCVLYRTSTQHNGAFFGILAPPGDPKAYP
jgi:hypothetical protein